LEVGARGVAAVLLDRPSDDAEVDAAHDVRVTLGGVEQRAAGEPDDTATVVGLRREAELPEQLHDSAYCGGLTLRSPPPSIDGRSLLGQLAAPRRASADRVVARRGAGALDHGGEGGREPAIGGLRFVRAVHCFVEPGGPATPARLGPPTLDQAHLDQRVDVLTERVDMQARRVREVGERDRSRLTAERREDRGTSRRQRWPWPSRQWPIARSWCSCRRAIFHGYECNKIVGVRLRGAASREGPHMNHVVLASDQADARAAAQVEEHHRHLAAALSALTDTLVRAAARGQETEAHAAMDELVAWSRQELLPHAVAEEKALYPVAHAQTEGRLLVEGMLGEHKVIASLVDSVATATNPVHAATAATALRVTVENHLTKENELLVPLLVSDPNVSLAELLQGMHELIGGHEHPEPEDSSDPSRDNGERPDAHDDQPAAARSTAHRCACGEHDELDDPELDTRVIPHALRHAAVFGALDAVRPGRGMVLVASHDPKPLLAQLEQRQPDTFDVEYVTRGPDVWRLRFVRRTG